MDQGARFPKVAGQGRPLRELLHQGLPAGRRARDLDPPHRPQAPRRRAQRLDLVRPLRPRRGGAAGDQGDGAGGGALGPGGIVDPGRSAPRSGRAGPRAPSTPTPSGAAWKLTFSGDAEPCKYLPADWLYEAPLPQTKFVAPFPTPDFDGRLEIDGETIELAGWPGMIGHNWGTEHAERWVWLEGTGFADSPDTYFDAGAARIKLGPRTTPWIPSGMLMLDGEAAPARRLRHDPLRLDRGVADRLHLRPPRQGHRRPRPRLRPAEGLRRLGLRRPQGPRAQHRQLLRRRPRADRRTPSAPAAAALTSRRRRLRAGDAGDRPRHPDPALPGRLSDTAEAARPTTFSEASSSWS